MKRSVKYVCSECGSDDILIRAWVAANENNAYVCDCDIDGVCYCEKCGHETRIKEIEVINKTE